MCPDPFRVRLTFCWGRGIGGTAEAKPGIHCIYILCRVTLGLVRTRSGLFGQGLEGQGTNRLRKAPTSGCVVQWMYRPRRPSSKGMNIGDFSFGDTSVRRLTLSSLKQHKFVYVFLTKKFTFLDFYRKSLICKRHQFEPQLCPS